MQRGKTKEWGDGVIQPQEENQAKRKREKLRCTVERQLVRDISPNLPFVYSMPYSLKAVWHVHGLPHCETMAGKLPSASRACNFSLSSSKKIWLRLRNINFQGCCVIASCIEDYMRLLLFRNMEKLFIADSACWSSDVASSVGISGAASKCLDETIQLRHEF